MLVSIFASCRMVDRKVLVNPLIHCVVVTLTELEMEPHCSLLLDRLATLYEVSAYFQET